MDWIDRLIIGGLHITAILTATTAMMLVLMWILK